MKISSVPFNKMCRGSSVSRLDEFGSSIVLVHLSFPRFSLHGLLVSGLQQFQALHFVPQCLNVWGVGDAVGYGGRKRACLFFHVFYEKHFTPKKFSPNRPSLRHYCSEPHHILIPQAN